MTGSLAERALAIAEGEDGVVEDGPPWANRGSKVSRYLASVGMPPGEPWCAAFVSWAIQQAEPDADKREFNCCAGAVRLAAINPTLVVHGRDPQPGDVFVIRHADGKGHCGFVTGYRPDPDRTIDTIEGNTDLDGGREGYGVFCHNRPVSSIWRFLEVR